VTDRRMGELEQQGAEAAHEQRRLELQTRGVGDAAGAGHADSRECQASAD
jgi:hypothetical protein